MSRTADAPLSLHALTALAAPLMLAQGLWVQATVPRLPEPPGARAGCEGSGPPLRLLVLGDSAAAGVGADSQLTALSGRLVARLAPHFRVDWRLLARTGDRVRDALAALRDAPDLHCDVALTSLGVNDATRLASPTRFITDMAAVVGHLRERCGARLMLLSGMPPVGEFPALPQPLRWRLGVQAQRLDAALQAFVDTQPDCEHLAFGPLPDRAVMASDGFHPGPPVYRLWAEAAAARISARLG
jgi:lysophospholipase L1-like esterase